MFVAEEAHDILRVTTPDNFKQAAVDQLPNMRQKTWLMPGDGFNERAAEVNICRNVVAAMQLQDPGETGPALNRAYGLAQSVPVLISFGNQILIRVMNERKRDSHSQHLALTKCESLLR